MLWHHNRRIIPTPLLSDIPGSNKMRRFRTGFHRSKKFVTQNKLATGIIGLVVLLPLSTGVYAIAQNDNFDQNKVKTSNKERVDQDNKEKISSEKKKISQQKNNSNTNSQSSNINGSTQSSSSSPNSTNDASSSNYSYEAGVCTKIPKPYKTAYVGTTNEVGYINIIGGKDGYTETCQADSTGYVYPPYTIEPITRYIYVGGNWNQHIIDTIHKYGTSYSAVKQRVDELCSPVINVSKNDPQAYSLCATGIMAVGGY
jgi:hypothetical protein